MANQELKDMLRAIMDQQSAQMEQMRVHLDETRAQVAASGQRVDGLDASLAGANRQIGEMEGRLTQQIQNVQELALTGGSGGINSGSAATNSPTPFTYMGGDREEKPPRFADTAELHPVDFVAQLEDYFCNMRVPGDRQAKLAVKCLDGTAKTWGTVLANRFADFSVFKTKFLARFWGEDRQRKIKYEIFSDQFKEGNMTQYFLDIVAKGTYLKPPMEEGELVRAVIRHFPPHIERSLISAKCANNIEDCVDMLGLLDDVGQREGRNKPPQPKMTYNNNNNTNNPTVGANNNNTRSNNWRQNNNVSGNQQANRFYQGRTNDARPIRSAEIEEDLDNNISNYIPPREADDVTEQGNENRPQT